MNRNDPCPCGSGKKYKRCCMQRPAVGRPGPGSPGPGKAATTEANIALAQAEDDRQSGRIEPALIAYDRVLAVFPEEPTALFGKARIVRAIGNLGEGLRLLDRAIAAEPGRAGFHVSRADMLLEARRHEEAMEAALKAVAIDPCLAAGHRWIAILHERANRVEEALEASRRAVDLAPDDANAGIVLARLERRSGDLESARNHLAEIADRPGLSPHLRYLALNELGFVLEALEEYSASFAAFERGGAAQLETPVARRIDTDAQSRLVASYRAGFTPELLARRAPGSGGDHRPAPAFLVGFPRSGTTMTEQILAAHPAIITADERPFVQALRAEVIAGAAPGPSGIPDVPAALARADEKAIRRLRARYWGAVDASLGADLGSRVFLDKLPLNLIDLGLINVIFPEARVIVALRDPRDVCLSCFQQRFELNIAMVNFLRWERTARFYTEVMDLWLHQREILTLRFLEIRYEDTVADLEGQARRILELLGLDWDGAMLDFQERARERMISTPSFEAVTQPIHRGAVERWRNYPEQVARVMGELGRFVEAFGYGETGRRTPPTT